MSTGGRAGRGIRVGHRAPTLGTEEQQGLQRANPAVGMRARTPGRQAGKPGGPAPTNKMDCHIAGQTRLLTALRERTEGSPRIASKRYSRTRGRAGPCPPAGEARAEEQPVSAAAGMGRRTRGSARAARGERGMGVRSAQDGRMARRSSPRSPIGRWCVRRDDTRAREVRLPPILFRRVTVTNMKARTIEL